MADLARVQFLYSGWAGGPGVSVLNFSPGTADWNDQADVDLFYDDLNTLTGSLVNMLVGGITLQASPELVIFDSATGDITDVKSPTASPTVHTSAAGTSRTSRATMMLIQYRTGVYVNGKQVKGRTFFGPLHSSNIAVDGLIESARLTDVPGWYSAILSGGGPRLCVYRRPGVGGTPAGLYEDVSNVSVRQTPSYLSSRLL